MEVKFLGHSCFFIEIEGNKILIDPFISGNPNINIDPLSLSANYILISHGHGDHIGDAVEISKHNKCPILANYEVAEYCKNKGAEAIGMNTGGRYDLGFVLVKFVNAIHSSKLPDGSYGGNPNGILVYNHSMSFYFAGDTALCTDMTLIPLIAPPLDFAILPMGDHYTMGIEESIFAAQFIKCNKIIACHFDTFPDIMLDRDKAKALYKQNSIELIIPTIGDNISIKS